MKSISKKTKIWLVFTTTIIVCFVLVLGLAYLEPVDRVQETNAMDSVGMPVSVLTVEPRAHAARVAALGEVIPVWESTVRTQVNGRIESISEALRAGALVKKGEVLVRLESSAYEAQAADARSRLASAETEFLQEELLAQEAQANWARSGIGGQPDSLLTLRTPQLKVARANVVAARTALEYAERQLGWTEIRAPFDGVVISRAIDLGESLFAGDEVGSFYGLDAVEVGIRLDHTEWNLLPKPLIGSEAKLREPQQNSEWVARVIRESQQLDRDSRLRTLFLRVEKPLEQEPPLLPGMFVRSELFGREITGMIRLPESALTKAGKVWFVDSENRLESHRAEPLFRGDGTVFIKVPDEMAQELRVAVSPNSSFISGLRVQAVEEEEGS
ncbi:MAG: efflux RND transporter periplasmic adaptor subunit [Opitutales bacterium]|nr:efflux RND transporter periplasmic adaptor subunit [Opitutales bacterium]